MFSGRARCSMVDYRRFYNSNLVLPWCFFGVIVWTLILGTFKIGQSPIDI